MNTEPPDGDDLGRMLVTMKQRVLERAAPRPARRRGRTGIVIGVIAVLALGTATSAVAVTLAQRSDPVAAPATSGAPLVPTGTPSSAPFTPTPRPTATPAPIGAVATLPTECAAVVPAADGDRLFHGTPVQDLTGTLRTSDAEQSWGMTTPALACRWMDPGADVSGLDIRIGTGDADTAAALRDAALPCEDAHGGVVCRKTEPADPYPVDTTTTYFVRDDTWIIIRQTNFPTDDLLGSVVDQIWGD